MAKSAKQILDGAIKDIEAGLWTCNELCVPVEGKVKRGHHVMGCALGLVGMNAGLATYQYDPYDDATYGYLNYPNEGTWSRPAIKAMQALAATTKLAKSRREQLANEDFSGFSVEPELVRQESEVIMYNDRGSTDVNKSLSKRSALNWFKRARALLDT